MSEYKIQVIIPVYKGEKTLKKCLDSLKAQTFSQWQAILINDASPDNSVGVIEKYMAEDDRFVLVNMEQNSGVAKTRNRGLEMLDAEYTAFLDCDDYLEEKAFEVMYGKVQETGCDVVQCRFIYDFENGSRVLPAGAFKKEVYLTGKGLRKVYRKMMTGINMNHVCMKLIRTELVKDIRFDTNLKTAEDLVFCINLFKKVKSYVFVPVPFYHYSRSSTSLTGNALSAKQKLECNKYAANVLLEALPIWGIDKLHYRILTKLRAYIIIVSKIFRTLREKLIARGK